MSDLLIILLLAFPQLPVPADSEPLRAAVIRVASDLDLATPNEGWGVWSFRAEVDWTRRTWRELADAPPSWDAVRWPPAFVCDDAIEANSAYVAWAYAQQAMAPRRWGAWEAILTDCLCRREAWWAARRAQQADASIATRRWSLQALRHALGEQDWWEGRLPAPVPGGP